MFEKKKDSSLGELGGQGVSNAKDGSRRSGGGEEKALSDIQIVDSLANFLPCDSGKIASSFSCSVFFLASAESVKSSTAQLHHSQFSFILFWVFCIQVISESLVYN